jgi:hypothetical protein
VGRLFAGRWHGVDHGRRRRGQARLVVARVLLDGTERHERALGEVVVVFVLLGDEERGLVGVVVVLEGKVAVGVGVSHVPLVGHGAKAQQLLANRG